jgi:hypothetical protein
MTPKEASPGIRVAFLLIFTVIARAAIFKAYNPYQK